MSVDISWDLITSGEDGDALAESIRAFIHDKFQQITLPKFINAVHVHSFEFGSISPNVEIKDICDPLPDFYEDEDEDEDEDALPAEDALDSHASELTSRQNNGPYDQFRRPNLPHLPSTANAAGLSLSGTMPLTSLEPHLPPFARSGTPGIPGGTSNMSYFHFPVGGLSGNHTPLATVAGGGPFNTQAWLNDQRSHYPPSTPHDLDGNGEKFRPRTADSISTHEVGSPLIPSSPEKKTLQPAEKVSDNVSSDDLQANSLPDISEKVLPSDLQVVARVAYNGDVRMMLTAEIMLDYPMPSFVKIPLKLSITGVDFDGVAILAYIKKRAHFCFLDPEDANTLVGNAFASASSSDNKRSTIGSLLREIRVETEIGRQESGKQVLKNVGKVESFVLDQVRRIFEDEFVFPSFWTFLV